MIRPVYLAEVIEKTFAIAMSYANDLVNHCVESRYEVADPIVEGVIKVAHEKTCSHFI